GIGENSLTVHLPTANEVARTELVSDAHLAPPPDLTPSVLVARELTENPFLEGLDRAKRLDARAIAAEPTIDQTLREFESVFLLVKVSEKLSTATSLNRFLEDVIDLTVDVALAKTGVCLLRDDQGRMIPAVVRHAGKLGQGEIPISDAVVQEVLKKKVALAVMDAQGDARFAARESVVMYGVNQLICAPMLRNGEVVGLIYLTRDSSQALPLTRLVDVVGAIAHITANGVEQWKLKEKILNAERVRAALERFHAPAVVERVLQDLQSGDGIANRMDAREVTVLFADISGFTSLTERIPPERVVDLLNEYYARMTRVVFSFDGTVDKFIGDGVMAIFGAPYARPDDASRAVRCALAMRREFVDMILHRPPDERCGLKVALNTGKVLAGTLGSESHLSYTALGDAVNIAARLQSSAHPGQVLMTGRTLAATGARFDVAPLGERELKGKREKVPVFEVLDEDQDLHTSPGV
ncbi:MAG: adenylate/guanylate cyclase domain-containing protein, partial [Myxococcales bacterium]